ncbi:MAG: peptidoglycan DD-metalloendopeptidase family protein [Firmicutes bacterium]|nr:peptidoglycan DD-metalloendopeptidase family protein [Bacillota bacterium]MBR3212688.1 peptidoglycan DD-metalloendopeptidase family protein [Bacillota bacterium]
MKRKLFSIFMCLVLTASMCVTAFADEYDDQIAEIEQEEEELKAEMNAISDEIAAKESALISLEAEIEATNRKISETESLIKDLTEDIRRTEASISGQESDLGHRLRNMYKNGTVGFIDVILNSTDLTDFLTNMDLVQRIYENDAAVLQELEEKRTRLIEDKAALETAKAELEEAKESLAWQEAEAKETRDALQAKKDELQARVDELEAEAERLREEAYLASLASDYTNPDGGSGVLGWPTDSRYITGYFGYRQHPIWGYYHGHEGIDIGANTGDNIYAAEAGQVVISSWYGGYGYAVAIYHGDGMTTLYGHNSALNVYVGQIVQRGEVIAYAGSTGWSTGPHCHFEVQINGTPVDPLGYLEL